jgi:hypothetical protein
LLVVFKCRIEVRWLRERVERTVRVTGNVLGGEVIAGAHDWIEIFRNESLGIFKPPAVLLFVKSILMEVLNYVFAFFPVSELLDDLGEVILSCHHSQVLWSDSECFQREVNKTRRIFNLASS